MHEFSIALDLVETAADEAERLGAARVDAVYVRIGLLAGVVNDALRFCFAEAAAGTIIEGARLEIEVQPVLVWCQACAANHELADILHRRCPVCGQLAPQVVSGDRIELTALMIVDHAAAHR